MDGSEDNNFSNTQQEIVEKAHNFTINRLSIKFMEKYKCQSELFRS